MNLYVLGNGFDRAHKLKTDYRSFKMWMLGKNGLLGRYQWMVDYTLPLVGFVEPFVVGYEPKGFANWFFHLIDDVQPFDDHDSWKQFEEDLGKIHWEYILENAGSIDVNKCDPENVTDEQRFEYEARMCFLSLAFLKDFFQEWIGMVNRKKVHENDMFKSFLNDTDNLFLTFNYTNTLERLYHPKRVFHIHGSVENGGDLIVGHSGGAYSMPNHLPSQDKAYEWFRRIYHQLAKPTDSIIRRNEDFFGSLSNIDNVYFFGFSFSKPDFPYLQEVFRRCKSIKMVYINAYNQYDFPVFESIVRKAGFTGRVSPWACVVE